MSRWPSHQLTDFSIHRINEGLSRFAIEPLTGIFPNRKTQEKPMKTRRSEKSMDNHIKKVQKERGTFFFFLHYHQKTINSLTTREKPRIGK